MAQRYDLAVIGGGAAGFVSSKLASGMGKKVVLIENNRLGGECTWSGCVPSKALLRAASAAHAVKTADRYGIKTSGEVTDASGAFQYARDAVQNVYNGHRPEAFEEEGIELIFGSPSFRDEKSIEVNGEVIEADKFIIATGSSPFVPPVSGFDSEHLLTNSNFFEQTDIPESLLVIGGGSIGTEMASAMNRLGSAVTVVEMMPRILMPEDEEMSVRLQEMLTAEGVSFFTGTKAISAEIGSNQVVLEVEDSRKERRILKAQRILAASGRKANVDGLNLEAAGVEYTDKGIRVNEKLQTSNDRIFAAGDVAGPFQFSHMAEYQAKTAVMNALLPIAAKRVDYTHVGWCTFTDPELAHIGVTEAEAREELGDSIKVYTFSYSGADRGKTDGTETGYAKYIVDSGGRLVGAHILGARAGELIHEAQIIKSLGKPFKELYGMIHIYPTYSDVVKQPAKNAYIDSLMSNPFINLAKRFRGDGD
ncbi:dihydrolipoyl dehydrogenase family protein [Limisalsivibrio acetivorans]|uniref:dihydrolipoyl dehydrogenase family protein n=1 Tax=Limisalsivibrio acetivorans TaxID=1304888 RepID=UPI0003B3974F|nr:FAD-dependent oxidoreductase [Limisalsivibrio acetivorans]